MKLYKNNLNALKKKNKGETQNNLTKKKSKRIPIFNQAHPTNL